CGGGCVCGAGQTTISLRSWSDPNIAAIPNIADTADTADITDTTVPAHILAEVVGEVAEESAGEGEVGVSRNLGAWQGGQAAAGAVEEVGGAFLMLRRQGLPRPGAQDVIAAPAGARPVVAVQQRRA